MMDYPLQGERSLGVCRRIKATYPRLPVIASGCNNNIHQEYNKLGFDCYIAKSFDLDLLYHIMRKHIPKPAPDPAWLIFSVIPDSYILEKRYG